MQLSRRTPLSTALIALTTLWLSACGSGPRVERHEGYSGPPTVAINPVIEGRPAASPPVSKWWIQKLLSEDLGRSAELAGAIALPSANAENEATVILDVSVTDLLWHDPGRHGGKLSLRIRSRDKTSGRVGINDTYSGSCDGCRAGTGQPPIAGPLADLTPRLARDLAHEHGG